MKVIKDETGVYMELPRDKIKFVSKEAEMMFDLSMENDYLEKENKELHNKIDKAIEYMNGEEFFLLMNSIQTPDKAVCEDYFKAKGNLLEILKDSDVDE